MKVLFAATPAIGHVNPLLAIARMARACGDDVLFTTARVFKEAVEAAGSRFVPLAAEADLDFRSVDKVIDDWATVPPGRRRSGSLWNAR
jgi:UDP:flavonoid glycosyltransferase YjiC (YdhE family)